MTTALQEGAFCEQECSEHADQKMKIHKFKDNWYALCPICNPVFDYEDIEVYDCFCSTCGDFLFAVSEPTVCYMCGKLACLQCEYVDHFFEEAICGSCANKVLDPAFQEEYLLKRNKKQLKK